MHYNWKRYSKFECPVCGRHIARKNPILNDTICKRLHEPAVMVDITPGKDGRPMVNKRGHVV